ncbi:MAG: hypothetical protein JXA78_15335 [Anaerolineales bacterium]|nr:hypothetical protein [Anaerolineales bacterium]
MPRRKKNKRQLSFIRETGGEYGAQLPDFASTPDEIKRAVEQNAINRGSLLIKVIVSLKIDSLLDAIAELSDQYDKEEIIEACDELGIDSEALRALDGIDPPIPYPCFFCSPDWLIKFPGLFFYYRNVAMLSRKVMNGIGYNTQPYEDGGIVPEKEVAIEIARYFNKIVSNLIKVSGVSTNRHLEMLYVNLGDSLGGISRNEVGRVASAKVIRYIVTHMHSLGLLVRVKYVLKDHYAEDDEENEDVVLIGQEQVLEISPDIDLESKLTELDNHRVKYRELVFSNGCALRLDRQVTWYSEKESKSYKIGPDFHSTTDGSDTMIWVAELKGGADPAGSDEHWKTATQALGRVIEASARAGKIKPKLSFMATILVERVASEAQQWVNEGKLTSVYNLTKIEESELERKKFLEDAYCFLGYMPD